LIKAVCRCDRADAAASFELRSVQPVDLYCERIAPGLRGEPLNTASNAAFLSLPGCCGDSQLRVVFLSARAWLRDPRFGHAV